MAENKFPCAGGFGGRDTVCIETDRIMDSCRDRDCFENVRVYLSNFGGEVLERTGSIRAKTAKILWTYIGLDPVQFNRGFYAVTVRFYLKLIFEACLGGGRSQELEGIAVLEKRVILYGGESNACIYRSHGLGEGFCALPEPNCGEKNIPTAVVEVVDPIVLGCRIMEYHDHCSCCCQCREGDMPRVVVDSLDAPLCFDEEHGRRFLTVSLGIFSVVRILRPAQYLINATEYCIPEKECVPVEEDDPCRVFRAMPFPVNEFCPRTAPGCGGPDKGGRCGCNS